MNDLEALRTSGVKLSDKEVAKLYIKNPEMWVLLEVLEIDETGNCLTSQIQPTQKPSAVDLQRWKPYIKI